MRLSEITRLSRDDWTGGKDYLSGRPGKKVYRPLPGGSGLYYSIENSRNPTIKLWKPTAQNSKPQLIGKLDLIAVDWFPLPDAVQVHTITVDEEYRGQGLAKAMYGIVLSIMHRPLVAGESQTPGGRRNWVSLAAIPGVQVRGYIIIDDSELTRNANIDALMGRLGGQYIGKNRGEDHFFAFDVEPKDTGAELTARVKTKLSQVYGDRSGIETGLYAVWTGQ